MATSLICREISQRGYLWVQGAGGNVSRKNEDKLWIKPSGLRLDEIRTDQDLALVDLLKIKDGLHSLSLVPHEESYSKLLVSCLLAGRRPSMETGLHAILPCRYVAHFHSLVSMLMFVEHHKSPERFLSWYRNSWESRFGQIAILPLVMPGLHLSLQMFGRQESRFILLQNHGVIIQDDDEIDLLGFGQMEIDFCEQFGYLKALPLLAGEHEPELKSAIRFLFPDFAIVFDELFPFLLKKDQVYECSIDAPLSLKEVWQAHCFLEQVAPSLSEIPSSFVQELVELPTEKFRMAKER